MEYLGDTYGGEPAPAEEGPLRVLEGVDILWNPWHHRLLDGDDFEALAKRNIRPWKFMQQPVHLHRFYMISTAST